MKKTQKNNLDEHIPLEGGDVTANDTDEGDKKEEEKPKKRQRRNIKAQALEAV